MERYLQKKAQARRPLDVPLLVLCGLMVVIAFSAIPPSDYLADATSFLAFALVLALFVAPMARILRKRRMWRDARAMARFFASQQKATVPLSALGDAAKLKNPGKRLAQLMDRGYLCNVQLDLAGSVALLTGLPRRAPEAAKPVEYIDVVCPHCGGTTRALPGRPCRCDYCDSMLPAAR